MIAPSPIFENRTEAGQQLAEALYHRRAELGLDRDEAIVVALPRGGIPVAEPVAARLGVSMDLILVRKLGVPSQPELAMGAIGEGGIEVLNDELIAFADVGRRQLAVEIRRERRELERRSRRYRTDRPRVPFTDRIVIIVDDGIATGSTATAACRVARAAGARTLILAVPVAPPDWVARLSGVADQYVALAMPENFRSVGHHYREFGQIEI